MHADDIRRTFLAFFEARDHKLYPSSSLIPPRETNLMLTTAGMVQFRPFFLGTEKPPVPRATSVQKSFRTTDLEEVGDETHLTLFEMLGNFSFGDYFKKEAIAWAWELVTTEFGLDPQRLWATVNYEDEESADLWLSQTPISPDRIQRLGTPLDERGDGPFNRHGEENYWTMGVAGPGGPNTELFYDRGEAYGEPGGPAVNGNRYLEIYNLVFMQFEIDDAGEIVKPLPAPSVDTGMGVERMATVLQDAASIYDTDLFSPVLDRASELTNSARGSSESTDRLLRTLADHSRSAAFLIADGVTPSNEGRGYVLRRVMRRAITKARLQGVKNQLLPGLCDAVIERFGHIYPELHRNSEAISLLVTREEERFTQTLEMGLRILEDAIDKSGDVLPGDVAFRLQDTFGFPLDITKDVAEEKGIPIDLDTYERLMEEQRSRSRDVGETTKKRTAQLRVDVAPTTFLGYDTRESEGTVLAIVQGVEQVTEARTGDEIDVIFDRTPFYAEGGGQIGDRGFLASAEATADVLDTQSAGALILHRVRVTAGELRPGLLMEQRVDASHRTGAEQAHTATHVLHHTLRNILGEHVRQMGSLVEPGRLRFDFSHFSSVDRDALSEAEEIVNQRIEADDAVRPFETNYRDAIDRYHAMAFFEDKYGDVVRVVEIGDYSYELCGGTHVPHTGRVGMVKILGEGSIGSNIRRIEALTGTEGLRWVNTRLEQAQRAAELIKVGPDDLLSGIERLIKTQKDLEKKLSAQQRSGVSDAVGQLVDQAKELPKGRLVVARRTEDVGVLRELAATLRDKLSPAVVVLGRAGDGSANLVCAVTKSLGIEAKSVIDEAAKRIGGRSGGGKPDLAMGGGNQPDVIDEALGVAATEAQRLLS